MLATRIPATEGPITRALLNIDEFSAMAFIKSSRPTISTRNDCRAGTSNALTTPIIAAIAINSPTVIRLVKVKNDSMEARIIELTWVATMMLRRFIRSATNPPIGPSRNMGIWPANATVPSSSDDPVRRYTSHASAMLSIHVPTSEIICPPKKSRKLRCFSERTISRNRERS